MNVRVTNHAVERYMERVRPGLDFAAAKGELLRLIRLHGVRAEKPPWLRTQAGVPEAAVWVSLGADVWLPCGVNESRMVATTVICRGSLSPEARERRRAAKRERRSAKQRGRASDHEHAVVVRRRAERDGAWAA